MGLRPKTTVSGAFSAQGADGMAIAHIFEGRSFVATSFWLVVVQGSSRDILLRLGPTFNAHATIVLDAWFIALGSFSLSIYENPTVTAPGTVLPAINMNRTSSRVAEATSFTGPGLSDTGTLLYQSYLFVPPVGPLPGQGANNISVGGAEGAPVPHWIFKRNNDYLIRITNETAASAQLASSGISWHEHI